MTSGIYKIRNTISGNIYVGSAVNISGRWSEHISRLKMGKHENQHLQRAWLKYSADVFEFLIIEECSKENLLEREQFLIDTLSPEYNICKVAGSPLGTKHSEESRAKMSAAQKGKTISPEHRAKLSARQKGKTFSAEIRAKMSEAKKNMSDETRAKMSVAKKGVKRKPRSIEHSAKISEANKGKIASDATRKKISEAKKEWWAERTKETK